MPRQRVSSGDGNANEAIALLQITEGSYNSVSDILIRMRELAVNPPDALTNKERAYLDTEFEDLTAGSHESRMWRMQRNQVVGRYRCVGFDDFQVGTKYSQRPDHHHIG